MMGDAWLADLKTIRDVPRRHVLLPQQLEYLPSRRIIQCFEKRIHSIFRQISKCLAFCQVSFSMGFGFE